MSLNLLFWSQKNIVSIKVSNLTPNIQVLNSFFTIWQKFSSETILHMFFPLLPSLFLCWCSQNSIFRCSSCLRTENVTNFLLANRLKFFSHFHIFSVESINWEEEEKQKTYFQFTHKYLLTQVLLRGEIGVSFPIKRRRRSQKGWPYKWCAQKESSAPEKRKKGRWWK